MSQTVDSRVVEMRFDNSQFEQNVKQSMTTLDRLKSSLNMDGASKSFNELNKAANGLNFEGLYKNVEMLSRRFSTFGIIGMRVIQNLTDSAMKFVHGTMNTVTNSIIGGGKRRAMNIENARFQLQGLLNDEVKVEAIMKDALDSVDGTAYAFDEAAKAASQFAATGMQAGEDMYGALRGITGVAAMTNSEYENISRIFTTVAGNGRVMGDQLLQLSSRGLNAAVTIKDYFNGVNNGTIEANDSIKEYIYSLTKGLEISEGELRDFVSAGKVSFDVFAKAMDNAFGEHAKKANDTLTGSISNVKAALARIGAEFISPLIVQKGPLVMFFNALRLRINDIKKNIGPMANMFTDAVSSIATSATRYLKNLSFVSFFDSFNTSLEKLHSFLDVHLFDRFGEFTRLITNAGLKLEDFQKAAFDVMAEKEIANAEERKRTVKSELKSYEDFISKYGSFQASLKSGWMTPQVFAKAIRKLTGDLQPMSDAFKTAEDVLKAFDDISNQVIRGNFGNGAERVKKLTAAGYDYATVQSVVNHKLLGWEIDLKNVTAAQLENLGYTKEQIEVFKKLAEEAETSGTSIEELIQSFTKPTGVELFFGTIHNIFKAFTNTISAFNDAWAESFSGLPELPLYSALKYINELSQKLLLSDKSLDNLKNTFKGVISVFKLGVGVLSSFGEALGNVIRAIDPSFTSFSDYILRFTGFLGEKISEIVDWIQVNEIVQKGLTPLVEVLETVVSKVKEFYDTYLKDMKVSEIFASFSKDAKGFFMDVDKWVGGAVDIFANLFSMLAQLKNGFTFDDIRAIFFNFVESVLSYVSALGGQFTNTRDSVKGFASVVSKELGAVEDKAKGFGDSVLNILEKIKGTFKNVKLGSVITLLGGAATLKFIGSLYKLITKRPTASIVDSFCGVLNSISGTINEFKKNLKYNNMIKLAIAIAIFAGSIYLLAQLDTDKLWMAIGAIVALATALTLLNLLMGITTKIGVLGSGVNDASKVLLSLAVSLGIIAFSLKQLEGLQNPEETLKMAAKIAVGFVAVVAALNLVSRIGVGKSSTLTGGTVLGVAASLFIIVEALRRLESIDAGKVNSKLPILIKVFALMGALMIASKFAGEHAQKAGIMMLALAVALKLMVSTIMILSLVKPSTLNKGIVAVLKIMSIFALVIIASKFAGQNAHKAGVMLLAMSATILIMVGAIALLSLMKSSDIKKAMSVIKQLMVCFALLIASTHFAGDFKSIIALTAAIAVLVMAVAALTFINERDLVRVVGALSLLMGMFALMSYSSSKLSTKAIPGILMMMAVVAALAVTIGLLSKLTDTDKALKSSIALSILLIAFAVSMRQLNSMVGLLGPAKKTILAMIIVVAALAVIIGLLTEFTTDADKMIKVSASLSLLLLTFSASCMILAMIGPLAGSAMAGIGALVGLIAAIGGILGGLAILDEFTNGKASKYLNDGIPMLNAIGRGLGEFIGSIAAGALDALNFTDIGANLSGLIEQLSSFFDSVDDIDSESIDKLPKITSALVGLAGAEFVDTVTSVIKKFTGVGDASSFAEKIKGFATAISDFATTAAAGSFDMEKVDSAVEIAHALSDINESLPRTGGKIQEWIGWKDLDKFSAGMSTLASGLHQFILILGNDNFDQEKMDGIAGLGQALADLNTSLPSTGGNLQEWLGWKDLDNFGANIVKLASGLHQFILILANDNFDKGKMDGIAGTGQMLADLNRNLPATGGNLQEWLGNQDLETFSTNLPKLASGLHQFILIVGNDKVDQGAIDAVMVVANMLTEFSSTVPTTGGLLDKLFGDNSLGGFGENIKTLGTGLNDFSHSMDDVNEASSTKVQKMLSALTGAQTMEVANAGGLSALGTELTQFGGALEQFDGALDGVNTEQMTSVLNAFSAFVEGLTGITKVDTSKVDDILAAIQKLGSIDTSSLSANLGTAGSMLSTLGAQMVVLFSNAVVANGGSVTNAAGTIISNFISSIQARFSLVTAAGLLIGTALAAGISSGSKAVSTAIVGPIMAAHLVAISYVPKFRADGTALVTALANGIGSVSISSKFTSKLSTAKSNVRSYYSSFHDAGQHLANGLANGIDSKISSVADKAAQMVAAAIRAARNKAEEASPSKVFYRIGDFIGQGLENGIADSEPGAYAAGASLAEQVKRGAMNSVKMISDLIENGIDDQPVITPVLDLSQIQNGVSSMNGMMTLNPALAVAGNLSSISSSFNNGSTATNDDVVRAINKLNKSIAEMPRESTTINGVTYDDGSNINNAVRQLVRAARIERRA